MTNKHIILGSIFAAAIAIAASCGDNLKAPDARIDSVHPDAMCSNCPAAPNLGAQIDRMGRPAINTVLNHGFDGTAAAGPAKDAYNVDSSKGTWSMYVGTPNPGTGQFAGNLAIVDVLDTGLTCADGACTVNAGATLSDGCGDQVLYNGAAGGSGSASANAMSYNTLAGILTDDELFIDATKTSCELPSHANYLAVEFNVVTGLDNSTCGGRAPSNDVIDTSYTALAIGVNGFKVGDGSYTAAFGDNVGPHADTSNDTFPFLGTPH